MEPLDPKAARIRADEARRLLDAEPTEHAAYRELAPEARRRRHLLDVIAFLFPDATPLELDQLDDFRRLWAWVHARHISWETWEPADPPTDDFANCVLDGRPDLTEEGASSETANWLSGESTDAWVAIAHGHDGHRFLFWDTSADELVIHEVDNQVPDVVTMTWNGVDDFLRGFLIESVLRTLDYYAGPRRRPRQPLTRREELGCTLGCLALVAGLIGFLWWLVT